MFSSRQQFLQALRAQRGDESRQDPVAAARGRASGQAAGSAVRQASGIAQQSQRSAYLQRVSLRGRFLQGVQERRRQQQLAIDVPKVPTCPRMPKPVGPIDEGPRSVQETFHVAGILLARMSRTLRRGVLHAKLANISWRVSTTFSGAMMPEIAVKALRKSYY